MNSSVPLIRRLLGASLLLWSALAAAAPAPTPTPIAAASKALSLAPEAAHVTEPEHLEHGSFRDVRVYRAQGPTRRFVLFLSGDGGWEQDHDRLARLLTAEGAMVAGIDTPELKTELEADGGDCVFPNGDLENLSHYLQAYYRVPTYLRPILIGFSSGGALAYAMLAQSPADTFAGALSIGLCPEFEMRKPLCSGVAVAEPAHKKKHHRRSRLLPVVKLPAPWLLMQGENDSVCPAAPARAFAAQVPGSETLLLSKAGHDDIATPQAIAMFRTAYAQLSKEQARAVAPPPPKLSDLPIVEVPATTVAGSHFAVLISGDGGWAGLDKDVATALAARGIPVVGIDSLRYFWTARTPEGLAADVDRVLRYYAAHWQKSEALLIGYSQGADVLPFAYNRLPQASKALVTHTVLMGLGENAAFEFHLSNWIGSAGDRPIAPEAQRLQAAQTLCLYGLDEDDSLCPKLPKQSVQAIGLEGGHHFDGGYEQVANLIVARTQRR